jgi:hypothetical protein
VNYGFHLTTTVKTPPIHMKMCERAQNSRLSATGNVRNVEARSGHCPGNSRIEICLEILVRPLEISYAKRYNPNRFLKIKGESRFALTAVSGI